jgi:hypothetical protein
VFPSQRQRLLAIAGLPALGIRVRLFQQTQQSFPRQRLVVNYQNLHSLPPPHSLYPPRTLLPQGITELNPEQSIGPHRMQPALPAVQNMQALTNVFQCDLVPFSAS